MAKGPSWKQRTILAIVATDSTFERVTHRGAEVYSGRCIHCNAHLVVRLDGEPVSRATIEHIKPRSHGGTDELSNLALACAGCNSEKGVRHDCRRPGDARLAEIVERLLEKRRRRWRDPAPG